MTLSRAVHGRWMALAILAIGLQGGCSQRDPNVKAFIKSQAAADIEAHISLVQLTADDIVLRVAIKNSETKAFNLLKWNLPPDGELTKSLFEVTCDGQKIDYTGKMVKRDLSAQDYFVLKPGEERVVNIGLAQGYDVKSRAECKVKYFVWNQDARQMPNNANLSVLTPILSNELIVSRKQGAGK